MTTLYIGSKFDGHDSAIFIADVDNERVYGLSSERLSRRKHDDIFPISALEKLINYAEIDPLTVCRIRFANSFSSDRATIYPINALEEEMARREAHPLPVERRQPLDQSVHATGAMADSPAPAGDPSVSNGAVAQKLETLHQCMGRHLRRLFPTAKISVRHHDHEYCHALSSYFFSSFDTALVVTMDGMGDRGNFSRAFIARESALTQLGASRSRERISDPWDRSAPFSKPCTPGGIYSYFTHKLGFAANCDEGKVEALAALGTCIPEIHDRLVGAASIDKRSHSIRIDVGAIRDVIADPRMRDPSTLGEKADLAATVQRFAEDVVLEYLAHLADVTQIWDICLSGGVFANVILNMKIAERISDRLFVTPAVGDDGSAQGAAVAELLCDGFTHRDLRWLRHLGMPYFGTSYSRSDILSSLTGRQDEIHFEDLERTWPEEAAERVHAGQVGAIFQGRMEWGPRALGNRSILLSPVNPAAKDILNGRVKRRPPFQPVCPAILEEEMHRLFEDAYPNKHMTSAFQMRPEHHAFLPSAIHVDGTARPQFVTESDNGPLFRLLTRLKTLSGYGVVLNTSFNMHGRTIVESPEDALRDFLDTDLDFLVIEGYLVTNKIREIA
jgi:carbamoyltransferase